MLPDKYTEVKLIVYLSIIRMKCPRSPTKVVGDAGATKSFEWSENAFLDARLLQDVD